MATPKPWYVYVLECMDGSLYTGIAVDVERRFALHSAGKGARYTRSHPPRRIAALVPCPDRSAASRAEYRVKQMSRAQKLALCLLLPAPGSTSATSPPD